MAPPDAPRTMTLREQILARIAANLRRAKPTATTTSHAHRVPARAVVEQKVTTAKLDDRFAAELEALAGHVHRCDDASQAIGVIVDLCHAHGASRVLGWDERLLDCRACAAVSRSTGSGTTLAGCRLRSRPCGSASSDGEDPGGRHRCDGRDRESGTLAVVSGPGRPRLASLLPPVHVAVLRAGLIHPSLPDFLAAHPRIADEGSNLVLITGPSRTADIEMTLTRGVHGPAEVHVILLQS